MNPIWGSFFSFILNLWIVLERTPTGVHFWCTDSEHIKSSPTYVQRKSTRNVSVRSQISATVNENVELLIVQQQTTGEPVLEEEGPVCNHEAIVGTFSDPESKPLQVGI